MSNWYSGEKELKILEERIKSIESVSVLMKEILVVLWRPLENEDVPFLDNSNKISSWICVS